MTAPYQRRRDPQPMSQGWEAPVAAFGGFLFGAVFAALAGLGVASAVWGGGWIWPHGSGSIRHAMGGLLRGNPGSGLPPEQARLVAAPVAVYTCVAVAELLLIMLAIAAGVLIARYRRPGDARRGMASRGEAAQVLGIRQLREARTIIRPDLYGQATASPRGEDGRS